MNVERAFSRAAKSYRSHATVQTKVASDLLSACGPLTHFKEAIDLGCGSGVLALEILSRYPTLPLDCLDSSAAMISELRATLTDRQLHPRALIVADARSYSGHEYPLVLSSSALQWMEPVDATLSNWRKLCASGGTLAVACMVRGTLVELHHARLQEAPSVPPLKELPTADAIRDSLRDAGFAVESFIERQYRVEFRSPIELYRALALTGTAGGSFSRGLRLLTVPELRRTARRYAADYATPDGGIYASYQVVLAVAKCP